MAEFYGMFNFLKKLSIFQSDWTILLSHWHCMRVLGAPYLHQPLILSFLWDLIVVLGYACLMTNSVEYLNVLSERGLQTRLVVWLHSLFLYGLRTKNSFYIFKLLKKNLKESNIL